MVSRSTLAAPTVMLGAAEVEQIPVILVVPAAVAIAAVAALGVVVKRRRSRNRPPKLEP
jgi:hypothetical protein